MERISTVPFFDNDGELVSGRYSIAEFNPLDKVLTLVTDRGQPVYGSQVICEYLDATSKARRMYPEPGPVRWHDAIAERPAVKRGTGVMADTVRARQGHIKVYSVIWDQDFSDLFQRIEVPMAILCGQGDVLWSVFERAKQMRPDAKVLRDRRDKFPAGSGRRWRGRGHTQLHRRAMICSGQALCILFIRQTLIEGTRWSARSSPVRYLRVSDRLRCEPGSLGFILHASGRSRTLSTVLSAK